ncbi:hypothetical protein IQ241_21465 [Romeria aff. gracilis LEGE 07310]|uniref:Uncharacterized protein n=1 Tax=Vasconcelosia minhoensis LEGE 07310 TaxID=915328 RepID=A0A8J7ASE3_9CYAN|nr:hypothetical protein [Romeria gracilis]MBE9079831.1 hypothetical protein [Romeria aff. gracilis LEGE 07310]
MAGTLLTGTSLNPTASDSGDIQRSIHSDSTPTADAISPAYTADSLQPAEPDSNGPIKSLVSPTETLQRQTDSATSEDQNISVDGPAQVEATEAVLYRQIEGHLPEAAAIAPNATTSDKEISALSQSSDPAPGLDAVQASYKAAEQLDMQQSSIQRASEDSTELARQSNSEQPEQTNTSANETSSQFNHLEAVLETSHPPLAANDVQRAAAEAEAPVLSTDLLAAELSGNAQAEQHPDLSNQFVTVGSSSSDQTETSQQMAIPPVLDSNQTTGQTTGSASELTQPAPIQPASIQRQVDEYSSASPMQLPTVLQPLGVLRPLPFLESRFALGEASPTHPATPTVSNSDNPAVMGSQPAALSPDTVQRQNEPVQRQESESAIPSEWSSLADLVAQATTPVSASSGSELADLSTDAIAPTTEHPLTEATVTNSDSIQRQLAESTDEIIQREASGESLDEWANLEEFVARALPKVSDSAASEPTSGTVSPTQQQLTPPAPAVQPVIVQAKSENFPTVTISRSSDADKADDIRDYSHYLELLAQEVYSLLRQRLSLEQERRGPKYPR